VSSDRRISELTANQNLLQQYLELTLSSWDNCKKFEKVSSQCKNPFEFFKNLPTLLGDGRSPEDSETIQQNNIELEPSENERKLVVNFLFNVSNRTTCISTRKPTYNQEIRYSLIQQITIVEANRNIQSSVITNLKKYLNNFGENGFREFSTNRADCNLLDDTIRRIETNCANGDAKFVKKYDLPFSKLVSIPSITSNPIRQPMRSPNKTYQIHVMVNRLTMSLKFNTYLKVKDGEKDRSGYTHLCTFSYKSITDFHAFRGDLVRIFGGTKSIAVTIQNLESIDKITRPHGILNFNRPVSGYFVAKDGSYNV